MPRPKRPRHIFSSPEITSFRPDGVHAGDEIILSLEEFEAIRLIDYEGMDQTQAANVMNVSRQTVGRILKAGRFKLSKTIVDAHILKVQGGCYRFKGHGPHGYGKGCGPRGGTHKKGGGGMHRRGPGKGRGRGKQHQP